MAALLACVSVLVAGCGKKGPPLPPLVRLPVAPGDFTASRRAATVDLQFVVPNANTDNTRPANVARVEVYALTAPPGTPEADIVARGTRIASVAVKAPRDPDATFDPDDPDQSEADVAPPEGPGLDQGALAHVREMLPPATAAAGSSEVRSYVGVGISTSGRRGPLSRRTAVPLTAPPPAPSAPEVSYTESAVTVRWPGSTPEPAPASPPAYHVYEVPAPGAGVTAPGSRDTTEEEQREPADERRLTEMPIAETEYIDPRITWGTTRCYAVRTVATVAGLTLESEPAPPACVTLRDTFPPAPPKGVQAVATEGVINLIWDANTEADLDGYILLRAMAPGDELIPIMTSLLHETAYQDPVPAGVRFVYAIQAVDRAGNLSPISERVEEAAR